MRSVWLGLGVGMMAIVAAPRVAPAAVCEDGWIDWRPSDGCPSAEERCLRIAASDANDVAFELMVLPQCNWDDVRFRVQRSNTALSCAGQTLRSSSDEGAAIVLRRPRDTVLERNPVSCDQQSSLPEHGICAPDQADDVLENVTIASCRIEGYYNGIEVAYSGDREEAKTLILNQYLAWYDHLDEAECRVGQIEDCTRAAAPRDITIAAVSTDGQQNCGIYVGSFAHDVTISGVTVEGTRNGPGIYLDAGSQRTEITGSTIRDNGREGIAIDASADNVIADNRIEGNGTRDGGNDARYRVGVALYKNFWEKRWADPAQLPRAQPSDRNVIENNEIVDHYYGVNVGLRQNTPDHDEAGAADAWGDPVYWYDDRQWPIPNDRYFRERTADNVVRQNLFQDSSYGVLVRDDRNDVLGNTFERSRFADVYVGSDVRQWAREPVYGGTVAGNVMSWKDGGAPSGFVGLRIADCTSDVEAWWNTGTTSTEACGLTRARLQAITATSSSTHTLAFGRRVGHTQAEQSWVVGDFDGDGRDDVVTLLVNNGRLRTWLHRTQTGAFAYKTGFQTLPWSHGTAGQWLAGNFYGSAADELLFIYRSGATTCARTFAAVGTGFVEIDQPGSGCMVIANRAWDAGQRWLATDVNRDGRDDLLHVYASGTTAMLEAHRAWNSPLAAWFTAAPTFSQSYGVWRAEDHYLAGDFDGDGAGDVMRIWRGPEDRAQLWAYYLSATGVVGSRNQDFSSAPGANDGAGFVVGRRWIASDFDGDGKKDVVLVYNRSGDARIWKHRSTGRAFAFVGIQTLETFVDTQRWLSGYFDSGAREDLLRISSHVWY